MFLCSDAGSLARADLRTSARARPPAPRRTITLSIPKLSSGFRGSENALIIAARLVANRCDSLSTFARITPISDNPGAIRSLLNTSGVAFGRIGVVLCDRDILTPDWAACCPHYPEVGCSDNCDVPNAEIPGWSLQEGQVGFCVLASRHRDTARKVFTIAGLLVLRPGGVIDFCEQTHMQHGHRSTTVLIFVLMTTFASGCRTRSLPKAVFLDKCRGAWAGQMIGVCYGEPYEFRFNGKPITQSFAPWHPKRIANAVNQDDCYVEMTFLKTLEDHGLDVTMAQAGQAFAQSKYPLWHANL